MLAALRLAEVVPNDTDGERNRYRLKQPCEVRDVLCALSRFEQTTSAVRRSAHSLRRRRNVFTFPEFRKRGSSLHSLNRGWRGDTGSVLLGEY